MEGNSETRSPGAEKCGCGRKRVTRRCDSGAELAGLAGEARHRIALRCIATLPSSSPLSADADVLVFGTFPAETGTRACPRLGCCCLISEAIRPLQPFAARAQV